MLFAWWREKKRGAFIGLHPFPVRSRYGLKLVVVDYGYVLVYRFADIALDAVCQCELAHWTACACSDKLYVYVLVLRIVLDELDVATVILESWPDSVDRFLDCLLVQDIIFHRIYLLLML